MQYREAPSETDMQTNRTHSRRWIMPQLSENETSAKTDHWDAVEKPKFERCLEKSIDQALEGNVIDGDTVLRNLGWLDEEMGLVSVWG